MRFCYWFRVLPNFAEWQQVACKLGYARLYRRFALVALWRCQAIYHTHRILSLILPFMAFLEGGSVHFTFEYLWDVLYITVTWYLNHSKLVLSMIQRLELVLSRYFDVGCSLDFFLWSFVCFFKVDFVLYTSRVYSFSRWVGKSWGCDYHTNQYGIQGGWQYFTCFWCVSYKVY